ncbi:hypothetical protein ABW20_dc0100681 [Dactylellina cionopaga]|nr:hypothetical protein ABW20_dc0100681 [Dactylellina cionopaga]
MLIGLCGTICAGKHTVANFLVETYDFQVLRLAAPNSTPLPKPSDKAATDVVVSHFPEDGDVTFQSVDELVDYVTPRWQQRFVTTEVWDENVLDTLLKRPFFLLVSVDAPIVLRWKRYIERSGGRIAATAYVGCLFHAAGEPGRAEE